MEQAIEEARLVAKELGGLEPGDRLEGAAQIDHAPVVRPAAIDRAGKIGRNALKQAWLAGGRARAGRLLPAGPSPLPVAPNHRQARSHPSALSASARTRKPPPRSPPRCPCRLPYSGETHGSARSERAAGHEDIARGPRFRKGRSKKFKGGSPC